MLLASLVTKSDDQFLVYMQWAKDVDAVGCFVVAAIAKKERREKFSLLWAGRGAHLKSQKRPWAGSYLSGPLPLFYRRLICSVALECIVCVREWHLMQRSPRTLVLQSHSHTYTFFLYLWGVGRKTLIYHIGEERETQKIDGQRDNETQKTF